MNFCLYIETIWKSLFSGNCHTWSFQQLLSSDIYILILTAFCTRSATFKKSSDSKSAKAGLYFSLVIFNSIVIFLSPKNEIFQSKIGCLKSCLKRSPFA